MKLIICGSRGITVSTDQITRELESIGWQPTVILCGLCPDSPDISGRDWARERQVPVENHPALWFRHGRAAGPMRNQEMVAAADALLAFWSGTSKGTAGIIRMAQTKGIPMKVVEVTR